MLSFFIWFNIFSNVEFLSFSENFESELIDHTEERLAYLHPNQRLKPNEEVNDGLLGSLLLVISLFCTGNCKFLCFDAVTWIYFKLILNKIFLMWIILFVFTTN